MRHINGGWYCDSLPTGEYVALIRESHLEHNGRRVELPQGQNLLYCRISPNGLKFAGVGHRGLVEDRAQEWDGTRWIDHGIAFGPRAVIYDKAGRLHIVQPPVAHGYRYVADDGRLVTANDTLHDPGRQVWEYTDTGGVAIGQGGDHIGYGEDPCIVFIDGKRRLISEGQCRFINVTRGLDHLQVEQFAIAFVREDQNAAQFFRLSREELLDLPEITTAQPPQLEPIPAVNRKLWRTSFDGGNGKFPRNCRMVTKYGHTVIETLDGKDLCYYVNGEPDGDAAAIVRAVDAAKQWEPRLLILAYVPHGVELPSNADYIGAECYWKVWETAQQYEENRRRVIREAARPVWVIPQGYSSNANNVGFTPIVNGEIQPADDPLALRRIVPIIGRIVRDEPNVIGLDLFSDGTWRKTGYLDHKEIQPDWEQLASTIQTPESDSGGGGGGQMPEPITIEIGNNYPKRWSRREPYLFWSIDITADRAIRKVEVSMEGDGSGPLRIEFPGRKDARWFRGVAWKPEINGTWWPLVKAFENQTDADPVGRQRGPHQVTVTDDPIEPQPDPGSLSFPIRAAFYYPWFPETWPAGSRYHPTLGQYDSSDLTIIDKHTQALEYGGFKAAIASWWGQGSKTDARFPLLLSRAEGKALRWAIYHEKEGSANPSVEEIRSDLTYIRDNYAKHPNYLRVGGKFVVFVYNADDADCSVAARWKQANTVGAHICLKVFGGFASCPEQPDSWHQYSPSSAVQIVGGHSYNIAPGFWRPNDPAPILERDLTRWNQNIRDMIASRAAWQLVTSLNEWGEGTAVESAKEWETASGFGAYLDALHANGEVIEPPPVGGNLDDQIELVKHLRRQLFPDLYRPDLIPHDESEEDEPEERAIEVNPEGYLRLDHNGNGMERGAYWAKHIAWALRSKGVGMVRAKPGSGNHAGATQAVPEGFTTDIVATADGVHWDFQIDSGAAGFPTWAREEHPENYPPVASRWVPAFHPDTP